MSFQNPVFIPGPTNMPEVLRRACDMPTLDHRSSLFKDILHPALDGVRRVVKSADASVFVFPSTGTGGWETAITNTLNPGDTVLAARNGMFSHKWIDMCQRHGLTVEIVETPWGGRHPRAEPVSEEILTAGPPATDQKGPVPRHPYEGTRHRACVRQSPPVAPRGWDCPRSHPAHCFFVAMVFSLRSGSIALRIRRLGKGRRFGRSPASQKGLSLLGPRGSGIAVLSGARPHLGAAENRRRAPHLFREHPRTWARGFMPPNALPLHGRPWGPAERVSRKGGRPMLLSRKASDNGSSPATPHRHRRCAAAVPMPGGLELWRPFPAPSFYSDTVSRGSRPTPRKAFGTASKDRSASPGTPLRRSPSGAGLGEVGGKSFRHRGHLSGNAGPDCLAALGGIRPAEDGPIGDLGPFGDITLGFGAVRRRATGLTAAPRPPSRWPPNKGEKRMKDAVTTQIPDFDDVIAAHERIRPYIHRTPVLTSQFMNELTGAELFFKCENFQKAGAFKVRGACNAVFGLTDEQAAKGVATHSSGNHALSLSLFRGKAAGNSCHVVILHTDPGQKKAAVRG